MRATSGSHAFRPGHKKANSGASMPEVYLVGTLSSTPLLHHTDCIKSTQQLTLESYLVG